MTYLSRKCCTLSFFVPDMKCAKRTLSCTACRRQNEVKAEVLPIAFAKTVHPLFLLCLRWPYLTSVQSVTALSLAGSSTSDPFCHRLHPEKSCLLSCYPGWITTMIYLSNYLIAYWTNFKGFIIMPFVGEKQTMLHLSSASFSGCQFQLKLITTSPH